MRIKVLSGGRKNIELPLSDAELNFQMRRIGIEETVPMCRLVKKKELRDREGTGVSACSFPACRDGHKCVFAFVKGHF